MPDRIAIVQSNYIPWKGYFDLIAAVDAFVLLDEVQYTRRDWRNRNRIKTAAGTRWLTIPVAVSGRYEQSIDETRVADGAWARSHLSVLEQAYADAPHLGRYREALRDVYADAAQLDRLSSINRMFIDRLCELLAIDTPVLWSSELEWADPDGVDRRNGRLVGICSALGAREYVSGPAARDYLDKAAFERAGVSVAWADYDGYPEYPQPHPPFEHGVTVIDLLLCTGPDAAGYRRPGVVVARG